MGKRDVSIKQYATSTRDDDCFRRVGAEIKLGKCKDALRRLRRCTADGIDNAKTLRLRLDTLTCLGENTQALREADEYVGRFPDDARGHRTRAALMVNLGQLQQAATSIERAIQLGPTNTADHKTRAVLYYHMRQPETMLQCADELVEATGDVARAEAIRGHASVLQGDIDAAGDHANTCHEADPNEPDCLQLRAIYRYASGDPHGALADFERIQAMGFPIDREWLDVLGRATADHTAGIPEIILRSAASPLTGPNTSETGATR